MTTDRQLRQRLTGVAAVAIVGLIAAVWLGGNRDLAEALGTNQEQQSSKTVESATLANLPAPAAEPPASRASIAIEMADAVDTEPPSESESPSELVPAAVIGSATVVVRVEDHHGSPLAGIEVALAEPGPWGTTKNGRARVSGPYGEARFPDVPLGPFLLLIAESTVPAMHLSAPVWKGRVDRPGEFAVTLVCAHGATIEGQVRRPDGHPVSGLMVRLVCEVKGISSVHRKPDADGRFRLEGAFPGRWVVSAQVRDRRAQIGSSLPAPTEVVARAGETAYAELLCKDAGKWITGRVVDQHEQPVDGLLVRAGRPYVSRDDPNPRLADEGHAFAITDAKGKYRLGPLPPHLHAVVVGDRHGTGGVTRDSALLAWRPRGYLAEPGDGIEHVTTVGRVEDVIHWRLRPKISTRLRESSGVKVADLHAKIGYCRLFLDDDGCWTFVTARSLESERKLSLSVGPFDGPGHKWKIALDPPPGDRVDRALTLPPD